MRRLTRWFNAHWVRYVHRRPQPVGSVRLFFEPRDLWVGLFWKFDTRLRYVDVPGKLMRDSELCLCLCVYVCLVPMLPLSLVIPVRKEEQW